MMEKLQEKINKKFGEKYTIISKNGDTLTLFCNNHKIYFEKSIHNIFRTNGCPECSKELFKDKIKLRKEKYIEKCIILHNNKYDYSKVNFEKITDDVTIICPEHGEFTQKFYSHLNGHGCQQCHFKHISDVFSYTKEEWVDKFKSVHGDLYSYDTAINFKYKIPIFCNVHQEHFYQLPTIHALGHGCPKCAYEKNINTTRLTTQQFIDKSKKIHGDLYDYSLVDYKFSHAKVEIVCKKHGKFLLRPNDHLAGYGCQICSAHNFISKPQQEINEFIKSFEVDTECPNRSVLKTKEIDIYVPKFNFGIEFNGLFWHSHNSKENKSQIMRHYDKYEACLKNNVFLIQIMEDEWLNPNKKEIIKSKIKYLLNKIDYHIYARKCVVKEINQKNFNDFCDLNHLQGGKNSSIRLGLFNELNKLVSVMGFHKHNIYEFEMSRYCVLKNTLVVGGANKLFTHFIKNYNPKQILSFADLRYSNGKLYKTLGFELESITKPNYKYVKNDKTFTRNMFQKSKLHKLLKNFDPTKSESENMFENGFRRIWDCGNQKWIWKRNKTDYN